MAHVDFDHFGVRPASDRLAGFSGQRTQTMLVLSGVGAIMIVVTAALFMTMF